MFDRLPNPPPVFVGRADELAWLDLAIPRAPLTLIWGPEGCGKSALICWWLHHRSGHDIEQLLYLSLPPASTPEALAESLLTQLVRASDLQRHLDLKELSRQPMAALGALLDLVDRQPRWIVWDDAHLVEPSLLADLLRMISRYVRRSRWIVLGRQPAWSLPAQTLLLQPLPRADRARLLSLWATPGAAIFDPLPLLDQHTSLRELERVWWGEQAGDALTPNQWSAAQRAALSLLLAAQRPIPRDALAHAADASPAEIDALADGRLTRESLAGLSLDPDQRPQLAAALSDTPAAARARMARALGAARSTALLMEGLRISITHALDDITDALLSARFEEIRDQGYLAELWSHLRELDRPALTGWRLRCASTLGDTHALSDLSRPTKPTWENMALWINALHHMGRFDQLDALARELPSLLPPPSADERLHASSILIQHAGALLTLGYVDKTLAILADPPPMLRWQESLAALLTIRALVHLGRRDEAMERLADHRARFSDLDTFHAARTAYTLVYIYYMLQEIGHAARIAAEAFDDPSRPVVLFSAQWLLLAGVALETGELDRARKFARHALLQHDAPCFNRASALCIIITTHGYDGDARAARAHLDTLHQEIAHYPPEIVAHARELALRLNMWAGEDAAAPALSWAADSISAEASEALAVTERLYALIHDLRPLPPAPPSHDEALPARASHAILATCEALINGEGDAAPLSSWVERLEGAGWNRFALDAALIACEQALLTAPASLARHASTLERLARRCGATRHIEEAMLFTQLAAAPLTRDQAARLLHDTPRAALAQRRVRYALGEEVRVDGLDRLIAGALRARCGWTIAPSAPQLAWGYDVATRTVWTAAGRTCALHNKRLAHLLICALARHGALSKEALTREVWGDHDYHPLRHDNRLRLLVKKLRQQLDEALDAQGWLLTLEDGYALREPFRLDGAI